MSNPARNWARQDVPLRWGVRVSLTSWTEPLLHVRWHAEVGLRLAREAFSDLGRPLTSSDRERLSPQEHADLDLAMLDRVRAVVSAERGQGGLMLAPASFFSIASASSRNRLVAELSTFKPEDRNALMFEIEDLALGTPLDRIKDALDGLRPYCRGMVVRCGPTRAAVEALRGCPTRGLSLDLDGVNGKAGEAFGRMKLLCERARGIVPDVMALGLPPTIPPQIMIAGGASFYSVRPDAPDEIEPV